MRSQLSFLLLSLFLVINSAQASRSASNRSPVKFTRSTDQDQSKYPPIDVHPPRSMTPQSWIDALDKAVADGLIPPIGPSVVAEDGTISYPKSAGNSDAICSWTVHKCLGPEDVLDPPANEIVLSFDDGPAAGSDELYDFLKKNNQSATHFMIGSQILTNLQQFKKAVDSGLHQFAVHTWSHTVQTSLSNEQVVADLGWTMQIIYDYSGKIPNIWRPPQGDVDSRVRAIAKEVFGLKTILWNDDSNDWCTQDDGSTACPDETPGLDESSISQAIQKFIYKEDRSKGLNILEHELNNYTVNHFKTYYPQLSALNWTALAVADMDGGSHWYGNSVDATSPNSNQKEMPASFQASSLPAKAVYISAESTNLTASSSQIKVASTSNGVVANKINIASTGVFTTISILVALCF